MEMFSALLGLCEGNPPSTDVFSSLVASAAQVWCFLLAVEQTINLPVIKDAIILMERHCKAVRQRVMNPPNNMPRLA